MIEKKKTSGHVGTRSPVSVVNRHAISSRPSYTPKKRMHRSLPTHKRWREPQPHRCVVDYQHRAFYKNMVYSEEHEAFLTK